MADRPSVADADGVAPPEGRVDEGGQSESDGAPEAVEALVPARPGSGLRSSLAEVVRDDLSSGRIGQAALALLQMIASRVERENVTLREERDSLNRELIASRGALASSQRRSAVLRDRLRADKQRKWFHDVLPALGGVLVALAAPDVNVSGTAVVFLIVGLALIAHRFFLPAPGADVEEE